MQTTSAIESIPQAAFQQLTKNGVIVQCCIHENCKAMACFNYEGRKTCIYCKNHSYEGMTNLVYLKNVKNTQMI